jgi:hypothetical protein
MSPETDNKIEVRLEENKGASRTFANVAAWSVAFGGVAASVATGAILIPLGVAAVGGVVGFLVSKKLDESTNSRI